MSQQTPLKSTRGAGPRASSCASTCQRGCASARGISCYRPPVSPRSLSLVACLALACGERVSPALPGPGADVEAPPAPAGVEAPSAAAPTSCQDEADEAAALRCWVALLAAPALAGRDNGSPGGAAARAAIIAGLRAYGLQPAGDAGGFE